MGISIPNIAFVEGDSVALENFTDLFLVANVVIINANPWHSAALTLYQLPDHRPGHRSPLSGRVAFNVYPGLEAPGLIC